MKARIKVDPERVIGQIDRNIYGQFMCRRVGCSEDGLYDPAHAAADEYGVRADVSGWIQDIGSPIMRWPGGCTGTTYHWLDGVGPKSDRPKKIDHHFGWPSDYSFGSVEFIEWCRRIGAEPHLNLAMGFGTMEEACNWLEYCNLSWDTKYSNLRRQHGYDEPFNVKYWQLGNENYGPWEIGHTSAESYAEQAREWSKVMRRLDKSIKMIAVGGHDRYSEDWARAVVPEVLPYVDYVAFHTYWHEYDGDDPWTGVLSGPDEAEHVLMAIDHVIKSAKKTTSIPEAGMRDVRVACTEWNVAPEGGMMGSHPKYDPFGPTYALRDALAVATFLNIMQRRCNEITLANVAQSINVVGLIMVTDDGAWREPVYWPMWMQAQNSGPFAVDAWVDTPSFDNQKRRQFGLPYVDVSVTLDPESSKLYLSLVNRSRDEPMDCEIVVQDALVGAEARVVELYHDNAMAMNGPDKPDAVTPSERTLTIPGASFTYELKPHAYAILELDLG